MSESRGGIIDAVNDRHRRTAFQRTIVGRLIRIRLAVFALAVIAFVVVAAVFAPYLTPYEPQSLVAFGSESPSRAHWFGTDQLGRDQLTRIVYGARASLIVSGVAAAVGVVVGLPLGLLAAWFGGPVDWITMRCVDAMLALPGIILPLLLVALLGGSVTTVGIALGISLSTIIARIARGQALAQKEREYVVAAASVGAGTTRMLLIHIAPNCLAPIIVATTLGMSFAIIAEAGLSFLGVGVQPPTPTWGGMLSTGLAAVQVHPWQVFAPGVAIFLIVLSLNFLGDALRDVLDPRLRGVL